MSKVLQGEQDAKGACFLLTLTIETKTTSSFPQARRTLDAPTSVGVSSRDRQGREDKGKLQIDF